MKSYSFTIKFKDEIGYFSQSQVISDIRSLVLYNGFVLGKNVNKLKKIDVKGNEVKVSVSLFRSEKEEDLEKAVNDIKYGLKKRNYKLITESNKKSRKIKKKVSKNKNTRKKSAINKTKKNKKKSLFFNLF